MDTLRTCHTVIIILDNLISLIGFILSSSNLLYPTKIGGWLDKTIKHVQKKIRVVRKNTKRILLPEYSLIFQMAWTQEKFGKLLDFLTNDTGDGNAAIFNGVEEYNCDHGSPLNDTVSQLFGTLKHCTSPREDSENEESTISTIIMCLLFAFVGYVCSKMN